jgi:hypothetical protein
VAVRQSDFFRLEPKAKHANRLVLEDQRVVRFLDNINRTWTDFLAPHGWANQDRNNE